jgi:hypothetical protein
LTEHTKSLILRIAKQEFQAAGFHATGHGISDLCQGAASTVPNAAEIKEGFSP